MLNLNYKDMQNNMMHIGFRKDFSKKRRVLVEGAWGGVRREGMKDKCKVGSLNIFLHSDYLLIRRCSEIRESP